MGIAYHELATGLASFPSNRAPAGRARPEGHEPIRVDLRPAAHYDGLNEGVPLSVQTSTTKEVLGSTPPAQRRRIRLRASRRWRFFGGLALLAGFLILLAAGLLLALTAAPAVPERWVTYLLWTGVCVIAELLWVPTLSREATVSMASAANLATLALWHAPIYAWLLLVSGWARRATFLWAVLPFVLISMLERMALGTSYFGKMVTYRLMGHMHRAFALPPKGHQINSLTQLTPAKFLSTPGLWVGLLLAAGLIVAAVRLRRERGPI